MAYGSADVLELREVDRPSIGDDEVLVQVRAAGLDRLRGLIAKERAEDLDALTQLIESGAVTPAIDRTYPLAEAPDAIRYLADGHAAGKVVITIFGRGRTDAL